MLGTSSTRPMNSRIYRELPEVRVTAPFLHKCLVNSAPANGPLGHNQFASKLDIKVITMKVHLRMRLHLNLLKDKYKYIRNLVGAKVISPTHDSVGRKIPKNLIWNVLKDRPSAYEIMDKSPRSKPPATGPPKSKR
jgi:hypothetical protein